MVGTLNKIIYRLQRDLQGQDLVEYALMAGFVAVAGGAIFPTTIVPQISGIFSKINFIFTETPGGGS